MFIGETELDFFEGEVIALTFQSSDPEKVDTFQANFSNTWKLPFTRVNTEEFGFSNEILSFSNFPYSIADARFFSDGVELFPYASLFLKSCEISGEMGGYFSVQLFGGTFNFFDFISERTLNDLSGLSSLNHTFNQATIDGSQANTFAEGYVYDIQANGKISSEKNGLYSDLTASIFVRKIWDQIFIEAGVTYNWPNIPAKFNQLIIPYTNDGDPFEAEKEQFVEDNRVFVYLSADATKNPGSNANEPIPYDRINRATDEIVRNPTVNDGGFPVPYVGPALENGTTANIIRKASGINPRGAILEIKMIYTASSDWGLDIQINAVGGLFSNQSIQYTSTTDERTVVSKIELSELIESVVITPTFPGSQTVVIKQGSFLSLKYLPPNLGYTWSVPSRLPAINQKDFIKDMAIRFGLIFSYDEYERRIDIIPFDNVLTNSNSGNSRNWSDKMDFGKKIGIEYALNGFAQNNFFTHGENDNSPEGLGDGNLTVSNTNLPADREAWKSPFSPTLDRSGVSFPVPELLRFSQTNSDDTGNPDEAEYDRESINPRLLFLPGQSGESWVGYTGEQGFFLFPNTIASPARARFSPECLFSTHLANNYDTYKSILNKTKKITAYFLLDTNDIQNIDFSIPIQIDHPEYRGFYYLAKIESWQPNKPARCVLYLLN